MVSFMRIHIIVPFAGAETFTPIWAREEAEVDFAADPLRAARCTTAFAATELKHYLSRTLLDPEIAFASRRPEHGRYIELGIADPASVADAFSLEPAGDGLAVVGAGRAGLLYGAYELLRLQGWRWYAPGPAGEIAPDPRAFLAMPAARRDYGPSMSLGRGLDFEYASMESAQFWLWMARNRLNVCGLRQATLPLIHKLGMQPKIGGHIFEAILDPDRPMPSGRTLWEEHPEWYGLPPDGARVKAKAQATQFCVSRPDLVAFLGEELIRLLAGRWADADRVDIWGFDTWGSTCACDDCRALGNNADQMLHFLSGLRRQVDQARASSRLRRPVQLVMCAYEGTATLAGPGRPIPANLVDAGDIIVYYPINRCYEHDLEDGACAFNAAYASALRSWLAPQPALPACAGEYFNVSKFEDISLLFTTRLARDLPFYHRAGVRGMTYMHVPMVNWGVRTLTQALYAQLAWNVETDVAAFLDEYFANWYGPHAPRLRQAYGLIERAWASISDWRAWAGRSVLSQLLAWDGARPPRPLPMDNHFATPANAVASGRASVALMRQALDLIDQARAEDQSISAQRAASPGAVAVNPVEARRLEQAGRYEARLGEDRRLLRYGIDVMMLMAELVAYHEALRAADGAAAEAAWSLVELAAASLDSTYVPIGYEWPGPGLESKDGLTRSQLRDVIRRCRSHRGREAAC
jgi:hypothetical protein